MSHAPLRLKKDVDRRLRNGHCWIYSNEVDNNQTPLRDFAPGDPVTIEAHNGKWLGFGYINPHTLLCARIVGRDRDFQFDQSLLVHRLRIALGLRERIYAKPFYRLAFGDADGLPGLVVDRYGDVLVVQVTTAGMERMKAEIVAALEKVITPQAILFRNDAGVREMEGLDLYVEEALGQVPEAVEIEEHGARFRIPMQGGQKTGWFFDQADNRRRMLRYTQGKRVLDLFSYIGGWGVGAAVGGAAEVLCVDSSAAALEAVNANAALNGLGDRVQTRQGDAFDVLKALREAQERFDVVLVDPPAFIKRRKDIKEGTLAYRRLNQAAIQVLSRDGILVSSSCSFHMTGESLLENINLAGRHTDRTMQLLESGHQGPDHPIHPAIPETSYLKTFYLRVLPSF